MQFDISSFFTMVDTNTEKLEDHYYDVARSISYYDTALLSFMHC
jgi:hypothetical protein